MRAVCGAVAAISHADMYTCNPDIAFASCVKSYISKVPATLQQAG